MTQRIPLIYRIAFTYFEPLSSLAGSLQILFAPESYLAIAAPNAALHYDPALRGVLTCVVGGWMTMFFNDTITLRIFHNDLKVWRCIVAAHLISDIVYGCAIAQDVGLATMVNPWVWTGNDWIMAVGTWPVTILKIAFLLGVGLGSGDGVASGARKRE